MASFRRQIRKSENFSVAAFKRWVDACLSFLKVKRQSIKFTTAAAIELIPHVVIKPSVLWRWLAFSYWFYISLVVAVISMNTLVYSAVDGALNRIYPPQTYKRMFGLMQGVRQDSRIEWQRNLILGLFWAGAGGLSIYILLLCLPRTAQKASAKAREQEVEADALVTLKPSESILLYNKALKLAVDRNHEAALKHKIDTLDNAIKAGTIHQSPSTPSEDSENPRTGTVALSRLDTHYRAGQADTVGPDGRYRIERKLGEGAMGAVFLAQDRTLCRQVALKKLTFGQNLNQQLATRFEQEARALARLCHPNIVQVYDLVTSRNQQWIAMEYVEGQDLDRIIEENGKLSVAESLAIGIQIADAMDHAHARGVVHRDFKPSNVLIDADGKPKITDFGIAKLTLSSIATIEGSLLGTPAFMSPEQARGEAADGRADIYALGVTLYQLITGDLPFAGDVKSILAQKIAGSPPSLSLLENQTSSSLASLVRKMMASDPAGRPASMNEVGQSLRSIA